MKKSGHDGIYYHKKDEMTPILKHPFQLSQAKFKGLMHIKWDLWTVKNTFHQILSAGQDKENLEEPGKKHTENISYFLNILFYRNQENK